MANLVFLALVCVLTWVVFRKCRQLQMKHAGLWIIGTFLLAPLFFPLFIIRCSQVEYQGKLSRRQEREARLRELARRRMDKASAFKREWEAQQLRRKKANPELASSRQAAAARRQQEMRRLEEQLQNQRRRHQEKLGIRQ